MPVLLLEVELKARDLRKIFFGLRFNLLVLRLFLHTVNLVEERKLFMVKVKTFMMCGFRSCWRVLEFDYCWLTA